MFMGTHRRAEPMVEVYAPRFGTSYVREAEVQQIISHRLKNEVEEYLVRWNGDWPASHTPCSWHPIRELAGDDGVNNSSTGSCLRHVQDYIETLRRNSSDNKGEMPLKRKSPDNTHHYRLSPFERLSDSRSPSVLSARSEASSGSSIENDERDTYNCTLEVKGHFIVAIPSSQPQFDTTILPTRSMIDRAWLLRSRVTASESKIRAEFVRRLAKIPGQKPVRLVNTRDCSTPPLSFSFIDGYVYRKGVEPPDSATMEGCVSCRPNMGGSCGCEYTKVCECLEYARVDERKLSDEERQKLKKVEGGYESSMGLPKRFPYSKGTGLLVTFYLESRHTVYECNDSCACGPVCKSRVVQKGRQVGLEIFKTKNRGWGIRCTETLRPGEFIDTYRGEVITREEADSRQEKGGKAKESYLFTLDKFHAEVEPKYEIDGEYLGGPTRFINHSCEPNCAVYPVSYNKHNPYLYDLAFFALREIKPFEELTFDYVDNDGTEEETRRTGFEDSIACLCGSENCRKVLWK